MRTTTARPRKRYLTIGMTTLATVALAVTACGEQHQPPPASSAKQLWTATVSTADSEAHAQPMEGKVVRVSPDGRIVVVGGGPTVAYDAATGRQLWQTMEDGMSDGIAWLAISPDGSAVYVTGTVAPRRADVGYRTVAYALATGKRLWASTFKGTGGERDEAASVVATKSLVIVDGMLTKGDQGMSVVTIAYDAKSGGQRWVSRSGGSEVEGWAPRGGHSLAANAAGTTVYETMTRFEGHVAGVATVAYDTATGAQRWSARYALPGDHEAMGAAAAVSPDDSTLVVNGTSEATTEPSSSDPFQAMDSLTLGYDTKTGKQRWVKTYNGPANNGDFTESVAFPPDGATVFVAGTSVGPGHVYGEDILVLAYDTTSGAQRWAVRWDGPIPADSDSTVSQPPKDATQTRAYGWDVAAAPDGSSVVAVGHIGPAPSADKYYAVLSLQAKTGAVSWTQTYRASASGDERFQASSVAIGKDGTVFVTGGASRTGMATVAYVPQR